MRYPESVATLAASLPGATRESSLWIFGSWARGRASGSSDVDALVAVSDRSRLEVARTLCAEAQVSAIVTDFAQLRALQFKAPLLALHLAIEARLVHGSQKLPRFDWDRSRREDSSRRAFGRLSAARRELSTWGPEDDVVQVLVFAAVKEWAMLDAALKGAPEFDRWTALRRREISRNQERALLELEAVWQAQRTRTPAPSLSDPEWAVGEALRIAPSVSRA